MLCTHVRACLSDYRTVVMISLAGHTPQSDTIVSNDSFFSRYCVGKSIGEDFVVSIIQVRYNM